MGGAKESMGCRAGRGVHNRGQVKGGYGRRGLCGARGGGLDGRLNAGYY
jgi:hypothetical protein